MIHILHPQTDSIIGLLDNNGEHVFWNDEHEQSVDGFNVFKFSIDSKSETSKYLEGRVRILIPSERGGYQEFIAHEIRTIKNKAAYSVGAESELDKQKIIIPGKYEGYTLKQYITLATTDTEYQMGNIEFVGSKTLTYDKYLGAYAFLKKVAKAFDVEVIFRVEVKANKIIGRYVDVVERMGAYEGKEIEYGKDLIGIEKTTYSERIVTALFCLGPVKEDGTQISTTVVDEEAFQRWGRYGKHLTPATPYEPESEDTEMTLERLIQLGTTELKKRIDSIDEYKVDAATIESVYPNEKVRLGDNVRIKNTEYQPPLYADARILSVKRSLTDPSSKTFVIGNVVTYSEEDILKTFRGLQDLYGAKVIRSDTKPPIRKDSVWIDTSGTVDVPNSVNPVTQDWEKFSPTDASEINGLVVGQPYNGVTTTPEEGLVVNRTDQLVKSLFNATDGISIQSRPDILSEFVKMFYVNELGELMVTGSLTSRSPTSVDYLILEHGDLNNSAGKNFISPSTVLPHGYDMQGATFSSYLKYYTHKLAIYVPAATYGVNNNIATTLNITDVDHVAMQGVLGIWFQSEAKEWYAYEELGSRTLSSLELVSLVTRISPTFAHTSEARTIYVNVLIIGVR